MFQLCLVVVTFSPLPLLPPLLLLLPPLTLNLSLKAYVGDGTDAFGYVGVDKAGEMIVVAFKGTSDLKDWVRQSEDGRDECCHGRQVVGGRTPSRGGGEGRTNVSYVQYVQEREDA